MMRAKTEEVIPGYPGTCTLSQRGSVWPLQQPFKTGSYAVRLHFMPAGHECTLDLSKTRDDRISDPELSSRSRESLTTLLSEGQIMVGQVEASVIEKWMTTVSQNGNLRSPLPAVLCHEIRRKVEQFAATKDLATHSFRTLSELLARGKSLLTAISQKTDIDHIWRMLDDISGTSPIATLLYFDFVTSMPSEPSQGPELLTGRMKNDLSALIREGKALLRGISNDDSSDLLATIKHHASNNALAKILYLEMLGQDNEGMMTERSQARLEELLEQGMQLLSKISEAEADDLRSTITQAAGVSPIAAVLYKHMLSAAAPSESEDGDIDDHEAEKEQIAGEGAKCLREMLQDGDQIMKEMSNPDFSQSLKAAAEQGSTTSQSRQIDPTSTQSMGRYRSSRMEFHDIKDLLERNAGEFRLLIEKLDDSGSLEESRVVDAISAVSGLEHVSRLDIEEVVRSFSRNGTVVVQDLFSSLRLQAGSWEDESEVSNLVYVESFYSQLLHAFGELEQARVSLRIGGVVRVAEFEQGLELHGLGDVDVSRLLSDLGMDVEGGCFDGDEFFYLLCGNAPSDEYSEDEKTLADPTWSAPSGNRAVHTPYSQDLPEQSAADVGWESDDDEFIDIQPCLDRQSRKTSGVPRAGAGLSVYTARLESSVRTLKGEIATYDRRNNDPQNRGSRAWRLWNQERQLAQHTLEAQKRKTVSPQVSSYSLINRQQSSSIVGDREAKGAKKRDKVGPLLTLVRSPAPKKRPQPPSSLSTKNLIQRNASSSSLGSGLTRSTSMLTRRKVSSGASDELPHGLMKEIREHRAETLAAAGGEQYTPHHEKAAVLIQSLFRGIRDRDMVRPLLREHVTSAIAIIFFRKMKVSELNTIFRSVRDNDRVGASLAVEARQTQDILEEMQAKETAECEAADKKAEKELVELEQAETEAEQEVEEAKVAHERMEKERDEMLAWQAKADRYRASYDQLKAAKGIVDDQDDSLRVLHPDVFREKNQWQGIYQRYQREREQYENAMAIMIKEKGESDRALYKAAQERKEWKEARAKALKERQEVEAFVLARKFTDPQVSLKERFRARVRTSADAARYVRKAEARKGEAVYMGVIQVDEENSYEGEFIVVKDLEEDELSRVFFSMSDEDDALDLEALQRAMLGVGRRLNLNEAERLVKSFDTDGNGTIEFDEFLAGFRRMVGMELPHGMGIERFGDGTLYEGEIFEDKRIGIGMYTTAGPDQQWYLGGWHLGYRQGAGIEGRFTSKGVMVPVAVVQCQRGARKCRERFNPEKEWHLRMLREYSLVVDTARKKAAKSRALVQKDIQLGLNRKSAHAVELERAEMDEGEMEEEEKDHAQRAEEHMKMMMLEGH